MRTSLYIALLLALFFIAGCSQSGDFGAFVVAQVAKFGGHTKTSAAFPKLEARWTVKQDANGFQASVTGASFASIAAGLEQIYGTPRMADDGSGTATHEPDRLWGAVDIGVAIHLIGHKDTTEIICIRGVKSMDELFGHKP
jgi:hypothetical protein